ncbi:ankyrin repeat domain-containing protein [Flaviaesturariibacter aridisoli]|uniref:Ankyrin repeat domain-containing protein n=1 Tax=Flaviaesturariibacter aridisoli TaxID=2545761 RepID=A0A4R4DY89_9BACT|nr:ankyrin repeat domain-containing protein [Flaviaesturariibacter aridisoli]TCZ68568.1 ankyrin repeat domain-containing protein [Flaviaesturariibacter aridisoli]
MFLPKALLELESLLPAPLPPVLRRFLARRPQGNAFGDLYFYGRSWVLERYREEVAAGGDPLRLPIARDAQGEFWVNLASEEVGQGATPVAGAPLFSTWIAGQRAAKKVANGQPLHRAARAGDLQKLQRLLRRGAPIDSPDAEGRTALMAALQAWQYEAASLLLDADPDLSLTDRAGHTALMWAAYRNQPALLQRMIARGADVHARTRSGEGLLYFALTGPRSVTEGGGKGSREVVALLLAAGLPVHAPQLPGGKPILALDPGETDDALWRWMEDRVR